MSVINITSVKREPVPPEVMIEVDQPFHSESGYFYGVGATGLPAS